MTANAKCTHEQILASVEIHEITTADGSDSKFAADVQLRCATCRVRFRFSGLPIGVDLHEPRVSVDGFELRAPIVPDAAATFFGMHRLPARQHEVAKA